VFEFVGYNRGIPEYETSGIEKDWGAITPGPFIIYSKGGSKNPSYNTHEPGHVIQYYILGEKYIPLVAIPSLISANFDNHQNMPWEKSANQLWYCLTGEHNEANPLYFGPNDND
jgi:hypothetical protein